MKIKEVKQCNIVLAGIGGQGVMLASNIIMQFFLECNMEVKKSEVHGMAQRGGSVTAHVRAGKNIFSPVIEFGTANFLIAIDEKEGFFYKNMLHASSGKVIELTADDKKKLIHTKNKNIALLAKFFNELASSGQFLSGVSKEKFKKRVDVSLSKTILKNRLETNKRVFEDYFV